MNKEEIVQMMERDCQQNLEFPSVGYDDLESCRAESDLIDACIATGDVNGIRYMIEDSMTELKRYKKYELTQVVLQVCFNHQEEIDLSTMEEIQDAIEEIGEIELKWGICIEKDEDSADDVTVCMIGGYKKI